VLGARGRKAARLPAFKGGETIAPAGNAVFDLRHRVGVPHPGWSRKVVVIAPAGCGAGA